MRKKDMIILGLTAVTTNLFLYEQNNKINFTKYNYYNKKVTDEMDGFKIVQLSDLHNRIFGKDNKKLYKILKKYPADIYVITGDTVNDHYIDNGDVLKLLSKLTMISPVYYIFGNHENNITKKNQNILIEQLKRIGVIVLDNEVVNIDGYFNLIGLNDKNKDDETFYSLINSINNDKLNIALVHQPQYFEKFSQTDLDLMISGHAHGGQINIPGTKQGLFAPGQGILPKYCSGIYENNKSTLIVSRGLGGKTIVPRLFNHPEIVQITLKKA